MSPDVGDFQSPSWKAAMPIHLAKYWSGADAPAERHAEVRVIWSSQGLHARFDCHQHEPVVSEANPQTAKKTIGLWDRDVCEIFLAPGSQTPEKYFEFEAAPTREWLDVAISLVEDVRESDWEFHSGMTVAAKMEESRVLVGMLIPWSSHLPRPQKGDLWRANFFRCVGSGADRGYVAWQPTFSPEPGFHVPAAFGWIEFV